MRKGRVYLVDNKGTVRGFNIWLLWDISSWVVLASAHFLSKDTYSFCSQLSFQGCLYGKQYRKIKYLPWKTEKLCYLSRIIKTLSSSREKVGQVYWQTFGKIEISLTWNSARCNVYSLRALHPRGHHPMDLSGQGELIRTRDSIIKSSACGPGVSQSTIIYDTMAS